MKQIIAAAVAWVCFAQMANGVLIPRNDPSIVGNGSVATDGFNLTYDTETGLEWLDATVSNYRPISWVKANLSGGGEFAGFRFATRPESFELLAHLGLSHPPFDDQVIAGAISLVGDTWGPNAELGRLGGFVMCLDEPQSEFAYWSIGVIDYGAASDDPDLALLGGVDAVVAEGIHGPLSYALVRTAAIPEPSSFILAAIAVASVAATMTMRPRNMQRG